ncbi:MAG: DUF1326 domain-containing protein [Terrimesophilobacter sp.]
MSWNVSGSYFESCNCDTVCPCIFLGAPTIGECTALVGWHIDDGDQDGLLLNGLNVALSVHSLGHMVETPWRVALYLDDRGSAEQQGALGSIFSGALGGHPAVLASHIGEVLGVASAPISFEGAGASRSMRVGDVADVAVTAIGGQGGARVTIANHPLAIAPGQEIVVAKSDHLRFADHGFEWEMSQKNGLFSPFAYQG